MTQIDLSTMQPGDAAAALRTFPQRFRDAARAAVEERDDHPEVAEVASRPGPDGWSATDVIDAAADRLAETQDVVRWALLHDGATAPAALVDATAPIQPGRGTGLGTALDRLTASAETFATTVHDARPERWNSTVAVEGGGTTTLLGVLQTGIAPVVGWLHEVDATMRAVRGGPQS